MPASQQQICYVCGRSDQPIHTDDLFAPGTLELRLKFQFRGRLSEHVQVFAIPTLCLECSDRLGITSAEEWEKYKGQHLAVTEAYINGILGLV
jgi:hypothetical protein